MRIVIELKRDAIADVVLNQLWRFSDLQTNSAPTCWRSTAAGREQLNLRDMIPAFTAFREEVVSRRTKYLLAKARDRAHVLVGLAIAVANIDEVIRLIRSAPSPAERAEEMMARDWPARDIGPLVELIADPRHRLADDGTFRLSDEQARAILELRLPRLTALGRDEIGDELKKLGEEIKDYLGDPVLARPHRRHRQGRAHRHQGRVRHAAAHRDRRDGGRGRGRGPDPARGRGRHRHATAATSSACRSPPIARSGAAARAAPAWRRATRISSPRSSSPRRTPRAVLLLARHVLPHEGLAAAGGTPQSIGKALVNLLPLGEGEASPRSCRCPRTRRPGPSWN